MINKLVELLEDEGVLYMSFKYGGYEGYRGDCYNTDFTDKSFREIVRKNLSCNIEEMKLSSDIRVDRDHEKWLNIFIRKTPNKDFQKGKYRHYKGNEYELIVIARGSETLEKMVVYKSLYGEKGMWVRPIAMWNEMVLVDGDYSKRFKKI